MSRWPRHKLEDVAIVLAGFAWRSEFFSDSPSSGPPIIRIQNLGQNENAKLVYYSGPIVLGYWVEPNEILISLSGSFKVCRWSGPRALLNQRIVVVRPQSSMRQEFLFYQLLSRVREIEKAAQGVAVSNTSMGIVREMEVDAPSLLEQDRIVRLLDEADQLRRMRTAADLRTSTLIPAIFYEMFPLSSNASRKFVEATLEQLVEQRDGSIRTGPFGSDLLHSEFTTQGIPVLGIDNVVANEFRWIEPRCIPESRYQAFKRFQVFPGDVLVTIMGTVGRCAVAPEDLPVCISTKHLCVVSLDRTRLEPYYLWASILFDESVRQQTRIVGSGAIMEGWNSTIIRSLRIRVPSMERQRAFATRVLETRALEADQASSRRRLDDLFQSLLHRAFQGEL